MKKPLALVAAGALTLALVTTGAQSASANTITAYCSTHLYENTALQSPPNQVLYCQMQEMGSYYYGYAGPVNGIMGPNSWAAVQRYLKEQWGYLGPTNGIPGVNTYKAMQRAGNSYGWYATPSAVDGTLEARDWKAWGYAIKVGFFGV